jgi:(R)-2-hydroxyacyl-CoA dehydratese activating ATPase
MAYAAGVDVGSTQTKAVIVDENAAIVGRALIDTGANVVAAAEKAFALALEANGITESEIGYVVGTGYGRFRVTFGNSQVTEISCHARGAVKLFPDTQTVLDMGGQDTKAIRVNSTGEVLDFCMNDKCAAGTGRFLQAAAYVLGIPLPELGETALRADKSIPITTTCTVFAESEVLSWLGKGKKIENILMGVHRSIAQRSIGLMRRVGIAEQITFTGGVTRNSGIVHVLNDMLHTNLNVSEDSHLMGAVGAALFALDQVAASRRPAAEKDSRI